MLPLSDALQRHKDEITEHLFVPGRWWPRLMRRVTLREREPDADGDFPDEQVWTFLIGSAYAIGGEEGVALLTKSLTGSPQTQPTDPRIWFEVMPLSPRKREGNTHVDLALGAIARRAHTDAGIELSGDASPWICFCEMKWYSDVEPRVTHDMRRNQLARVIENALCFQTRGEYADTVCVTLVTPVIFRPDGDKSRLYQYKLEEYRRDRSALLRDLEATPMKPRTQSDWLYPSAVLDKRSARLALRWVSYDELFNGLPDSPIAAEVEGFWQRHGNYQGRRV